VAERVWATKTQAVDAVIAVAVHLSRHQCISVRLGRKSASAVRNLIAVARKGEWETPYALERSAGILAERWILGDYRRRNSTGISYASALRTASRRARPEAMARLVEAGFAPPMPDVSSYRRPGGEWVWTEAAA